MINSVFAGLAALTLLCTVLMAAGFFRLLKRLAPAPSNATRLAVGALAAMLGWLLITGLLAKAGILSAWDARPARLPFIPLLALLSVVLLNRTALMRRLLTVTPRHWPVAFETFRIGVELAFLGLFLAGGAPSQVTFEGRNFDVLVGLTAPFVAFAIWKFGLRPRAVIAWNVLGLAILSNTILTTISSTPGPLHLNWPGAAFTAFGSWPFIWIPGFLAPLAIFLHIFSIRQNLALLKQARLRSVSQP